MSIMASSLVFFIKFLKIQAIESLFLVPSFRLFLFCLFSPILMCSFFIYLIIFILFYCYPLQTCFLMIDKQKVDLDGKGGGKELEEIK